MPNLIDRLVQEHSQTLPPLIQQLLTVNEHQRVDAPFGNQPGRDCRLAKRCRCVYDTLIVSNDRVHSIHLMFPECSMKLYIQRCAG